MRELNYYEFTNYGHIGKDNLPWEQLDSVNKIKQYFTKEKNDFYKLIMIGVKMKKEIIIGNKTKILISIDCSYIEFTLDKKELIDKIVCLEIFDDNFDVSISYLTIKILDSSVIVTKDPSLIYRDDLEERNYHIDEGNAINLYNYSFSNEKIKFKLLKNYLITDFCTNNLYCNVYVYELTENRKINKVFELIEKLCTLISIQDLYFI